MPRPDVDAVTGVPPSIALEQTDRTSRRTLHRGNGHRGRALPTPAVREARRSALSGARRADHVSERGCDVCGGAGIESGISLLAPVVRARKGLYLDVFTAAAREGIERAICDGVLVSTDDPPRLAKTKEHTIDLVIAETSGARRSSSAKPSSVRFAGEAEASSSARALTERLLSSPERVSDLRPFRPGARSPVVLVQHAPRAVRRLRGRRPGRERLGRSGRRRIPTERAYVPCPSCEGSRLSPLPRAVRLEGHRYHEVVRLSVAGALTLHPSLAALRRQKNDWRPDRAASSSDVWRSSRASGSTTCRSIAERSTLSGGEMQRLRLAAQLGAGLTGALYVLDEPTIGLHPRDTGRLLANLRDLVDIGSTVLVVEHDAETIRAADHLIDLGPGGGSHGGRVMAEGRADLVLANPLSPTGRALAEPAELRAPLVVARSHPLLRLKGARENNLNRVTLNVPLGRFVVVAGVSGSGKSTLVSRVLLPALRRELDLVSEEPGSHDALVGRGSLERAVAVDQSPIGRTPRSVPATFLGIWDPIRRLFASTPDGKVAGYGPSRFSFNTPTGGRCPTCGGAGVITHEMSFLPDVVTACAACDGKRFEPRTLDIRYAGLSIGDVLDLTAEEAVEFFANHPHIAAPLRTLTDLGAGYIHLGQGSHTLSGGEAQRLKLAAELTASTRHTPTLYVLDEPTTGLHLADVAKLVRVLSRLVERGDTLVVIEHHPVVIAGADWVVELGPDGGERGGRIVAEGPPISVSKKQTPTGEVLNQLFLASSPRRKRGSRADSVLVAG